MSFKSYVNQIFVEVEVVKGEAEMRSPKANVTLKPNGVSKMGFLGFMAMLVVLVTPPTFAAEPKKAIEFPPYHFVEGTDGQWDWAKSDEADFRYKDLATEKIWDVTIAPPAVPPAPGADPVVPPEWKKGAEEVMKELTHSSQGERDGFDNSNKFVDLANTVGRMFSKMANTPALVPPAGGADDLKNKIKLVIKAFAENYEIHFGDHGVVKKGPDGKIIPGEGDIKMNKTGILALLEKLADERVLKALKLATSDADFEKVLKKMVFNDPKLLKKLGMRGDKPTEEKIIAEEKEEADDNFVGPPAPPKPAKKQELSTGADIRHYWCAMPPVAKQNNGKDIWDAIKAMQAHLKNRNEEDDKGPSVLDKLAALNKEEPEEKVATPAPTANPAPVASNPQPAKAEEANPYAQNLQPEQTAGPATGGLPYLGNGPTLTQLDETAAPDAKVSTTGEAEVADFQNTLEDDKNLVKTAAKDLAKADFQPGAFAQNPGDPLTNFFAVNGKVMTKKRNLETAAQDARDQAASARSEAASWSIELKKLDPSGNFETANQKIAAIQKNYDQLNAEAQKYMAAMSATQDPSKQQQLQQKATQFQTLAQQAMTKKENATKNLTLAMKQFKNGEYATLEAKIKEATQVAKQLTSQATQLDARASDFDDVSTANKQTLASIKQQQQQQNSPRPGSGDATVADYMNGGAGGSGSGFSRRRGNAFSAAQATGTGALAGSPSNFRRANLAGEQLM